MVRGYRGNGPFSVDINTPDEEPPTPKVGASFDSEKFSQVTLRGVEVRGDSIRSTNTTLELRWDSSGNFQMSEEVAFIARDGFIYVASNSNDNPVQLNDEILTRDVAVPLATGDHVAIGENRFVVADPERVLLPQDLKSKQFSRIVIEGISLRNPNESTVLTDDVDGGKNLLGIEGVNVRRDDSGSTWITDHRTPDPEWDDVNDMGRVVSFTSPLHVNGNRVKKDRPVHLQHGDEINVDFHFAAVRMDSILLKKMPAWLKRLVSHLSKLGDTPALTDILSRIPYGVRLGDDIRAVLDGKRSILSLPEAFGIRDGVMKYMTRMIEEWRAAGFHELGPHTIRRNLSMELEREFWTLAEVVRLRTRIEAVNSLESVARVVEKSPLEYIENRRPSYIATRIRDIAKHGGGDMGSLPRLVKQRVRDILDEALASGRIVPTRKAKSSSGSGDAPLSTTSARALSLSDILRGEKLQLYDEIRRGGPYPNSHRDYSAEEMGELAYQVLERGKFVVLLPRGNKSTMKIRQRVLSLMERTVERAEKLYPTEMALRRNPFNGESVKKDDVPSRYRLANMLINRDAGRAIFGEPTEIENQHLIRVMQPIFNEPFSGHVDVQRRLRRALESGDPSDWWKIKNFLDVATPDQKALLLETYFGNYQHRDISNIENAFRIAGLFGLSGVYREVGVTVEIRDGRLYPSVTLGDMNSVSPEDHNRFFVLHTHPEIYLNMLGKIMGQRHDGDHAGNETAHLDVSNLKILRDTRNILFSRKDIDCFMNAATRYAANIKVPSLIYDAEKEVFRTWVLHPLGGSLMLVEMLNGKPHEITIQYGIDESRGNTDKNYRKQKARLEKYVEENWREWSDSPITLRFQRFKSSYNDFLRTIPFSLSPDENR